MKFSKTISIVTTALLIFNNMLNTPLDATDTIDSDVTVQATNKIPAYSCLLDEETIPEAIDYDEVLQRGHCERLTEKEDTLNKVVFANTDGTQSCYIFNYPVKYINEAGDTVDKSMEIKKDSVSNNFVSSASDICTLFSELLNNGIKISYEDISVKLIPNFATDQTDVAELATDKKSVSYQINEDISLEYSLTYQGFKENIILNKYTGIHEFSFTLLTNGLKLSSDEFGTFNLYNENEEVVVNLGEIIVFDADGDEFIGNLSYEVITEGKEYILTISVDEDFLDNSKTNYPVCIDPTLEINYNNTAGSEFYNDENAIHHCTIYNDGTYNIAETMVVGKYNTKIARTLMRFPALLDSAASHDGSIGVLSMDPEQIINAKVYLRDVGLQSDLDSIDVYCHRFKVRWSTEHELADYDESSWNLLGSTSENTIDPTPVDVKKICHSNGISLIPLHYYAFDITSIVKYWCDHEMDVTDGIIFKASEEVESGNSLYCSFGSYNSGYYAPYLVIDYTTPYGYDYVDDASITYTYQYRTFLTAGQTYIFQTEKATDYLNCDTELYLFKSDMSPGNNSWYNDDESASSRYSRIEAKIQTSGTYVLMALRYSSLNVNGLYPSGYCNIYQVDSETKEKNLLKENAQLGGYKLALTQNINSYSTIYNSFTTDLKKPTTCNPVMYILGVDTSDNRKVIGYNDNYTKVGDSSWGRASRVKQTYSSNCIPKCIIVTSSSTSTTGTVDIYGFCKGTYKKAHFPNLKEDDAIVSAPSSYAYNCISYSGGITGCWINPQMTYGVPVDENPLNSYLTPWYNSNNIVALDNFYGNNPPRYAGATTYEVTNDATEAVINVYKNVDEWTHAAVKSPANNQPHGYAWESKLGSNVRIFHPEEALNSSIYGQIARRYKIVEDNTVASHSITKSIPNEITFEESFDLGLTEISDIELSYEEKQFLSNVVNSTDDIVASEFDFFYSNWIERIKNDRTLSNTSNSLDFVKNAEYFDLSEYIDNNNSTLFIIINRYINDPNIFNTILFSSKVVNENSETIALANSIREYNNEISIESMNKSKYVAPSFETNALCFIKEYLCNKKMTLTE